MVLKEKTNNTNHTERILASTEVTEKYLLMEQAGKEINSDLTAAITKMISGHQEIFNGMSLNISLNVIDWYPSIQWSIRAENNTRKIRLIGVTAEPFCIGASGNRFNAHISEDLLKLEALKPLGYSALTTILNKEKRAARDEAEKTSDKLQEELLDVVRSVLEASAKKYGGQVAQVWTINRNKEPGWFQVVPAW